MSCNRSVQVSAQLYSKCPKIVLSLSLTVPTPQHSNKAKTHKQQWNRAMGRANRAMGRVDGWRHRFLLRRDHVFSGSGAPGPRILGLRGTRRTGSAPSSHTYVCPRNKNPTWSFDTDTGERVTILLPMVITRKRRRRTRRR